LSGSQVHSDLPVDPSLLTSPLLARGGYAVYENVFTRTALDALVLEARERYWAGDEQVTAVAAGDVGRGGHPTRKLVYSGGGEVQNDLYAAPALVRFLERICGARVRPTGERGGFLYYTRRGDHIGLHLDVDKCELVVLTMLQDHSPPGTTGGSYVIFPDHVGAAIPNVREAAQQGAGLRVKLRPGQSLVMLGGLVPHLVRPVDAQQARITSALCFTAGEAAFAGGPAGE
jgi:hypothetical protein